ncbi:MAG: DEAD/DEAH box helicase [Novosphingobium sp.]
MSTNASPASSGASTPLRTMQFIRNRAVEAVIGQSAINHAGLLAEIRRQFGSSDVDNGALVREPVIEGAAPFVSGDRSFAECAGSLLHPDVIRAISSEQAGEYRFAPDMRPYRHQLEAWEHLTAADKRSVLVSSGTGSGKTECFLMPLLHDLATEAAGAGRLSGVRALSLYPLNALIESQKERLRAWTAPFGDRIRFGLYNGQTPDKLRAQDKPGPEQAADREALRNDPPPILVTNATMLEYMLVRRIDRRLIENSRGKLRWIILDEAHGYVGSAAAEIALLLRRALLTFGVSAEDVRFVATSATIGDGKDVTDELRRFLRDISGAAAGRVHVVLGEREKVTLPTPASSPELATDALERPAAVTANPAVQAFIRKAEKHPVSLTDAQRLLRPTGQPLDYVIEAISGNAADPILPLRVHGFLRAVPGLWSCINPACSAAPADWPFGAVLPERVESCPHCQSVVLEIKMCRECGEPYLEGEERAGHLQACYTPPTVDEFAALRERELSEEDSAGDEGGASTQATDDYAPIHRAIAIRALTGGRPLHVEIANGRCQDAAGEGTQILSVHDADNCGACRATSGARGDLLRPMRYGAPFLIGNAAPVLLEGVTPRAQESVEAYRPPAQGRQLLSFTDSRQGTARFAASLQTNAERGYVRSYIYHAVQGSMASPAGDNSAADKLRDEIATLEGVDNQALAELIANKKEELARLKAPSVDGIAWSKLRTDLAAQAEVKHWMTRVWGLRDDRFQKEPTSFAEFLLLREFNRRPRRGNTIETMGLGRLRFAAIDRISRIPEQLATRGKTLQDWHGLLYSIVDMTIRGRGAIHASWEDMHWLNAGRPLSTLLPPGQASTARRELVWPMVKAAGGLPGNLVLILEQALGLDRTEPQDRHDLNAILEAAWEALHPLLYDPTRPDLALDFDKAHIAPVTDAWLCPVTRRVLPNLALGMTQYGHRESLATAGQMPQPINFPQLPVTFPKDDDADTLRDWLERDPALVTLREMGLWTNLHDRVALFAPYMRAAEHSAQQPPHRLRRFETEFKKGEINILNCSTTMEMGVDIGSVSAVMMTNVPPSLANYRQRVGRAGRRGQGFASSLTYTRDVPLDREAFHDPVAYLQRETRAPRVRLDSRRIVQRHVNAMLLARWFAGAGGEALKAQTGDFFGYPEGVGATRPPSPPVEQFLAWLELLSTQDSLQSEIQTLVKDTALDGSRDLFAASVSAMRAADEALRLEWEALQAEASAAPPAARAGMEYQLRRLARENLLGELAVRGFLPAYGLPVGVVPFVHRDKPAPDESDDSATAARHRNYPSRTLDIAIRDYAPGSQVVVDGLVYTSAGVTLNWKRPADDAEAREIQNIKVFWTCPACGAADIASIAPQHCPACRASIPFEAHRRFLEPSGFMVDVHEKPHTSTDEITFVPSEPEQIVAKGAAWQPFADPQLGRMRVSSDGLVFFSSRGAHQQGYHICLECGRAEPVPANPHGPSPLADHRPLRATHRGGNDLCPGNDKSFKITQPLSLGHETNTDVAEIQPADLASEGGAWAAVSALREALARVLGIEAGELGMAVRLARGPADQRTHSLYLFDRNAGGAGFASQTATLFGDVLQEARKILDCHVPGCTHGCSACVLTPDVQQNQQVVLDRVAALEWVDHALQMLGHVAPEDQAAPDAVLSRSVADDAIAALGMGGRDVTVWIGGDSDVAGLTDGLFALFARTVSNRGARLSVIVEPDWIDALDAAARLALRDTAKVLTLDLRKGAAPQYPNGARAIAMLGGDKPAVWASRHIPATHPGSDWGQGGAAPVVRFAGTPVPLAARVELDSLLPSADTHYIEVASQLDGPLNTFGSRMADLLLPAIQAAGGAGPLQAITYNDRYLQTPLILRLLVDVCAALRERLAGKDAGAPLPMRIMTNSLRKNERQPFAPDHDWQWEQDRRDALAGLLLARDFQPELVEHGAEHGRVMQLHFASGNDVRIIFDQGFGPWRAPHVARFDFAVSGMEQARALLQFNALLTSRGPGYIVVTA